MFLDPRIKSLAKKDVYALNLTALKAKHYEYYKKICDVRQETQSEELESVDCNSDASSSDDSGAVHGE